MSELVVFTYENEQEAFEALATVVSKKQENVQAPLVAIEDAAVAVKSAHGKVKIRQTMEAAAKSGSVFSSSMWGLIVGFLFGGPLLMAALGGGISALIGRKLDLGISNDFIDEVSASLKPGNSALFLLTNGADPATIAGALGEHGGTLFHTTMADDAAAALAEASEDAELAAAVEAEHAD